MAANLSDTQKEAVLGAEYQRIFSDFRSAVPDYHPSLENARALSDCLQRNGMFLNADNLIWAYRALKALGTDLSKPLPVAQQVTAAQPMAPEPEFPLTPTGISSIDALIDYAQVRQMKSEVYRHFYFGPHQKAFRQRVAELTEKAKQSGGLSKDAWNNWRKKDYNKEQ
jgi:hypothetical protein